MWSSWLNKCETPAKWVVASEMIWSPLQSKTSQYVSVEHEVHVPNHDSREGRTGPRELQGTAQVENIRKTWFPQDPFS